MRPLSDPPTPEVVEIGDDCRDSGRVKRHKGSCHCEREQNIEDFSGEWRASDSSAEELPKVRKEAWQAKEEEKHVSEPN